MDLLSTVLVAAAAIELLGALLFAFAFVRRGADREFRVAALLCVAAAEHAVATLLSLHAPGVTAAIAAERAAWVGLFAAMPMSVHFAIAYRGQRPRRRLLVPLYAAAAVLVAADMRTRLVGSSLGVAAYAAAGMAAAAVLVVIARAYLAGQREALTVVVGTTVLLATLVNDVGVAAGSFATGYVVDAGLAAFVVGIATTPGARYVAVMRALEARTRELRSRSRELRRSYEELRAAQAELVKKEQLAVVGELAAVIAHEVRNPLAIIANAVAGLRRVGLSREDHGTLLSILDEETTRLNRLVTDLLRYARPVNVQRSQIALADLLERALGIADAAGRNLRVELEVDCHDARVWGDANLLRQVFENLVDNAAQAMTGGAGTLTVRLRASTQDGVDGVAVDIIDTGEGMDTQVRSRARDPFFTTRPSGTGLGLAIVDRIVHAHGGEFAIDSRAGEGTTVTVFLPHGSPSEPPPMRPRVSSRPPSDPPRAAE